MLKALVQTSFLILFSSSAVSAPDISRARTLKKKGPEGDEEIDMVIKASGKKLKITAKHSILDDMSGSGRLRGDAIKFKLSAKEMPMSIESTGTVTGDKMSGTRVIQSGGGSRGWDGHDGPGGPDDMGGEVDMSEIPKEGTAEKQ
jgi:hypothetical protein